MTVAEWTQVIVASTALAAVLFGPLLQWRIARRQAADNISAKRQNWIDELRKDCAELLTLIARLEELRRPNPSLSEEDQKENFDEMAKASLRAHELTIRVQLRLNPEESEHNQLLENFKSLSETSKDPGPGETAEQRNAAIKEFGTARHKIVRQLQRILKSEWNRVKRGDLN